MNNNFLKILIDPITGQNLKLIDEVYDNNRVKSGLIISADQKIKYEIKNYIPRFVTDEKYAKSFGREWSFFNKTQLDSFTKTTISKDRWTDITGYKPKDMIGKTVLEAGCGSGRFLEVIAPYAEKCIGIDLSQAIDVSRDNIMNKFNSADFVQADLLNLPIKKNSVDFVYSIGVLHHTPDTLGGIKSLFKIIKPGGELAVWLYGPHTPIYPYDLFRFIGSRTNPEKLLSFLKKYVPFALKSHKIPLIGKFFRILFPAPEYPNIPIPDHLRLEWSILDAFDGFATQIENHYSEDELHDMLLQAGLTNIRKCNIYNSFIGQKP